ATRDCDWARVTGTGTRQRKRKRDGFLFNSCYLHGTCVLSLPSLLPLIFLLLQLPRSKTRRGTSEDPGGTEDDWTRRRRACGWTHVHFSAVPSLYSGAPGGWSTWRRTHTVPRQPQRAPTSGAACRRVDVVTQLVRCGTGRRGRTYTYLDTDWNSITCYDL
ncbi:hypothetical protein DFH08DRAFT_899702, partial [Mycena albidolilacea]